MVFNVKKLFVPNKISLLKLPAVLLICPALVVLLLSILLDGQSTNSKPAAVRIVDLIQEAPMTLEFYIILAILLGLFLSWQSYLHISLQNKFKSGYRTAVQQGFKHWDWYVYHGFRKRALTLRTGAACMLISVFLLLFGGVYFVLFIVQQIDILDRILTSERSRITLVERFGDKFNSLIEGHYWFRAKGIERSIREFMPGSLAFGGENGCGTESTTQRVRFAHSKFGYLTFPSGTVFLTKDGGQNWDKVNLILKPTETIIRAVVDKDNGEALIFGTLGSVFLLENDQIKHRYNLDTQTSNTVLDERFIKLCVNTDGDGFIVGSRGSIFITDDGGNTWKTGSEKLKSVFSNQSMTFTNISLFDNGRGLIHAINLSSSNRIQMTTQGLSGVVFVTNDFGKSWEPASFQKNTRGFNDQISFVRLHDNDVGLILTMIGSVFKTVNGGKNWDLVYQPDLPSNFMPGYAPALSSSKTTGAAFADIMNNERGLFITTLGWVYDNKISNDSWTDKINIYDSVKLPADRLIVDVQFNDELTVGFTKSSSGSVFLTTNGGASWELIESLRSQRGWTIYPASIAFQEKNKQGMAIHSEFDIFVTEDYSNDWKLTKWDVEQQGIISLVGFLSGDEIDSAVAIDKDGNAYFLVKNADVSGWENRPISELVKDMSNIPHINSSKLFQEFQAFVANVEYNQEEPWPDTKQSFIGVSLDELLILRTITLFILFFLVHTLVRLYQYNIRLATFWDARGDAMMLRKKFVKKNTETFDELIRVLTPDSYDFKPMSKSPPNLPPR